MPQNQLRVGFTNGETLTVDLSDAIARIPLLAPLSDPERFARARVGEFGLTIEWGDDIDLAADNLFARAKEQAGEASHEMFFAWMHRNGLSMSQAAEALGMSQRMIAYYRSGAKPIPKHVWLACQGWELLRKRAA
ncbi:MAG: DUF2442 domain-containing protein [Deltaproteobacteria bacterium]|nr:DUF2442 domain-containing protein [Deltaproteobacteria bacterium]